MYRLSWIGLAVCLLGQSLLADPISVDEYHTRRANLRKDLHGALVLLGRNEGNDDPYGMIQEPNFYYLTGWTDPGATLILTASSETLFLPHHNLRREKFTGPRGSAEDPNIRTVTGFDQVLPVEKFEASLDQALENSEEIYILNQPGAEKFKQLYPFRTFADAAPLLARLRVKKSPAEVAAIQHATDVTVEGHRAAWKRMAPGLYEYQLRRHGNQCLHGPRLRAACLRPHCRLWPQRRNSALCRQQAPHG